VTRELLEIERPGDPVELRRAGTKDALSLAGRPVDEEELVRRGKINKESAAAPVGCPIGPMIQEDMHAIVAAMSPDVEDVEIELTWDPPWTPDRMSDDAKFILGFG